MHKLKALVTGVLLLGILTACGHSASISAPPYYGAGGYCYYVNSPLEVISLQNAGLCPRTWVAYPMPLAFHERYYRYYASPTYYNHYAPASTRKTWGTRAKQFYATHKSQIKQTTATVKSKTSSTVNRNSSGTKINLNKRSTGGSVSRRTSRH